MIPLLCALIILLVNLYSRYIQSASIRSVINNIDGCCQRFSERGSSTSSPLFHFPLMQSVRQGRLAS
ncbi:MAG: hypothetical protein C4527_13345 [Candidatus Omnitrophota bacterium]|nr:MAG: hypothetical protein C4527_13345 [Candidatus Omnitrophota bacterium]